MIEILREGGGSGWLVLNAKFLSNHHWQPFNVIHGNVDQQKQLIQQFLKIDIKGQEMKDKLSPGGDAARTQMNS